MTVDILIATVNKNLKNVPLVLLEEREDVSYIVSVQDIDGFGYEIPHTLKNRRDVKVVFCAGKGLSLNRNNCLKYSTKDICIIADDDVTYKDSYIDRIKNEFMKDPFLDILIGKIKTNLNEPEFRNYKSKIYKINIFNFKNVCSVEIAFKREVIMSNNLFFDTNFGLGSAKFSVGGEESIFIRDAILKKLRVFYFPIYIVNHNYESSGSLNIFNKKFKVYLGAYSKRVFGVFGAFLFFYFLYRYKGDIKSVSSFFSDFFEGFKCKSKHETNKNKIIFF